MGAKLWIVEPGKYRVDADLVSISTSCRGTGIQVEGPTDEWRSEEIRSETGVVLIHPSGVPAFSSPGEMRDFRVWLSETESMRVTLPDALRKSLMITTSTVSRGAFDLAVFMARGGRVVCFSGGRSDLRGELEALWKLWGLHPECEYTFTPLAGLAGRFRWTAVGTADFKLDPPPNFEVLSEPLWSLSVLLEGWLLLWGEAGGVRFEKLRQQLGLEWTGDHRRFAFSQTRPDRLLPRGGNGSAWFSGVGRRNDLFTIKTDRDFAALLPWGSPPAPQGLLRDCKPILRTQESISLARQVATVLTNTEWSPCDLPGGHLRLLWELSTKDGMRQGFEAVTALLEASSATCDSASTDDSLLDSIFDGSSPAFEAVRDRLAWFLEGCRREILSVLQSRRLVVLELKRSALNHNEVKKPPFFYFWKSNATSANIQEALERWRTISPQAHQLVELMDLGDGYRIPNPALVDWDPGVEDELGIPHELAKGIAQEAQRGVLEVDIRAVLTELDTAASTAAGGGEQAPPDVEHLRRQVFRLKGWLRHLKGAGRLAELARLDAEAST